MKLQSTFVTTPAFRRLVASLGIAACLSAHADLAPFNATVDARGQINVWKFREDVSRVGPLLAPGQCDEADGQDKQARRMRSVCLARVQAQQQRQDAFNAAWMPALLEATKRGDPVAEVILLRCDTTPVLDRTRYPSTCSGDSKRAVQRLREIGFAPAIPLETEPGYCVPGHCEVRAPNSVEVLQQLVLRAFSHGNFGPIPDLAEKFNAEPKNDPALQYRIARNAALIEAARQETRRAFVFSPYAGAWDTMNHGLPDLAIDRLVSRPATMSWGPELLIGADDLERLRKDHWRTAPFEPAICNPDRTKCVDVAFGRPKPRTWMYPYPRVTDQDFERDLGGIVQAAQANIDKYLAQDPRWAVFLAHRVGHHEWVPEGLHTDSGKLAREWLGAWVFANGAAEITQEGSRTRITTRSTSTSPQHAAQLPDVQACDLRYSGGLTPFGFGRNPRFSDHLRLKERPDGLEVLHPRKRYRQVLMQCDGAEAPDNARVRFLLLAEDTLVEVGTELDAAEMRVRHFKRPRTASKDNTE